ncbi:hypothetical protein FQN55_002527 [Onygenales sp. PD_40]|nr:hypothetical protein FQN55_002527 [Onygenales sp. PD_40]
MATDTSSIGPTPEVSYRRLESGQGQIDDPQKSTRSHEVYEGEFCNEDYQEFLRPFFWYQSTDGSLLESPSITVTEGFDDFSTAIANPQIDGFQVCAVTAKCDILRKKLRMSMIPQDLSQIQERIVTILAERWEIKRKIIYDLLVTKPFRAPSWRIHLPSGSVYTGQPKNAQGPATAYCLNTEGFFWSWNGHVTFPNSVDLINNTSSFIEYMTYEGRRKPSTGKLQYLLHLSDYQQSGVDCCRKAMSTTSNLSKSFSRPLTLVEAIQLDFIEDIRKDLDCLQAEFQNTKEKVLVLREALKGQLDLAQMQRTYLLTVLVGLYVPISFVSVSNSAAVYNP